MVEGLPEAGAWYDLWHIHPNSSADVGRWDGPLGAWARVEQAGRGSGRPWQSWLIIDVADVRDDAVYLHTPNPNRDNFPYRFEGVCWGAEPPAWLAGLIDPSAVELGRSEDGGAIRYGGSTPDPAPQRTRPAPSPPGRRQRRDVGRGSRTVSDPEPGWHEPLWFEASDRGRSAGRPVEGRSFECVALAPPPVVVLLVGVLRRVAGRVAAAGIRLLGDFLIRPLLCSAFRACLSLILLTLTLFPRPSLPGCVAHKPRVPASRLGPRVNGSNPSGAT